MKALQTRKIIVTLEIFNTIFFINILVKLLDIPLEVAYDVLWIYC